jgi:hypothetical protein
MAQHCFRCCGGGKKVRKKERKKEKKVMKLTLKISKYALLNLVCDCRFESTISWCFGRPSCSFIVLYGERW